MPTGHLIPTSAGARFTRFGNLPAELRAIIWEYALPGPRVVYIENSLLERPHCYRVRSDRAIADFDQHGCPRFFDCTDEVSDEEYQRLVEEEAIGPMVEYDSDNRGFRTRSSPPVLLSVCRESFQVVSRHYERAFGTVSTFPETWFDFKIDTLYINWGHCDGMPYEPEDFVEAELERVRYLALDDGDRSHTHGFECYEDWFAFVLAWFPNVERISLPRSDPSHTKTEASDVVLRDCVNVGFALHCKYLPKDPDAVEDEMYDRATQDCRLREDPLDFDKLERYRSERNGGKTLRPLPEVVVQIFTTPRIHAKLLAEETDHIRACKFYESEIDCQKTAAAAAVSRALNTTEPI